MLCVTDYQLLQAKKEPNYQMRIVGKKNLPNFLLFNTVCPTPKHSHLRRKGGSWGCCSDSSACVVDAPPTWLSIIQQRRQDTTTLLASLYRSQPNLCRALPSCCTRAALASTPMQPNAQSSFPLPRCCFRHQRTAHFIGPRCSPWSFRAPSETYDSHTQYSITLYFVFFSIVRIYIEYVVGLSEPRQQTPSSTQSLAVLARRLFDRPCRQEKSGRTETSAPHTGEPASRAVTFRIFQ